MANPSGSPVPLIGRILFQKNLAIMGGLLVLAAYGAGGYSIDNRNAAGG